MQRKNKPGKSCGRKAKVHMLDMDLKEVLREHALRYLPAKALSRSLTVCRDWKLQISSPFFVHNQSVSCRLFSGVFVQSPGGPPSFISLDQMAYGVPDQELKFLPEPVDVKASSNGLLCCVGRGIDRAYYVCNPVNQQWKKLPKPSNDHGPNPVVALVFEPSVLSFIADFKVVCVFASPDLEGAFEFEIYSLDRDSWKVSSEMYFASSSMSFGNVKPQFGGVTYIDGVVYFPICSYKVLSFDMKTQKAAETNFGYGYGYARSKSSSLGSMDGKPCVSSIQNQNFTVTIIHGRHGNTMSSGSKANLHTSHASQVNSEDVKLVGIDRPRVLLTWDGIVVFYVGNKVFSHDMKTHKTKALVHREKKIGDELIVLPYVNSLVTLM